MIIKTKEFDRKFSHDIDWITINRRLPLWQKGSYKVTEFGYPITDIDLQARVHFNPRLLRIISNVLDKNRSTRSPFSFIHMSVGKYDGYSVPWNIDDKGGCDYDPKNVIKWFDEFKMKGLVQDSTLYYIKKKLFSRNMLIRNLIDVENILHPYEEIVWSRNDIERGYITQGGTKYMLSDAMQTETPVLEFAYYHRNNEYIPVDVGLVDKKFAVPPSGKMYRYYTNDWYKIMKTFRWKLPEDERKEYFIFLNNINSLIALKYQVGLIEKLTRGRVFNRDRLDAMRTRVYRSLENLLIPYKGISMVDIGLFLYERVNNVLKNHVSYFAKKLKKEDRKSIMYGLKRGIESQIPTTIGKLAARRKGGIKCPFFPVDIGEFDQLVPLAIRLDMKTETVVNCFSKVALEMGKSVAEIIKDVVQKNSLSILVEKDDIILMENNKVKKRYPLSEKKKLQILVLTGSLFS
jgi:hypothetical protein